jgi:hypothetical protein
MLSVFTMALLAAAPDAALLDALADQALAMEAFWKKASCELDVVGEEKRQRRQGDEEHEDLDARRARWHDGDAHAAAP